MATADSPNTPDARTLSLIVDVANVVGCRPDGWWRDRAGATARVLAALDAVVGRPVAVPGAGSAASPCTFAHITSVIEGVARTTACAPRVPGHRVLAAAGSGDDAIVELLRPHTADHAGGVMVVTSDRGLRARLPAAVLVVGAGWLRDLLD